MSLSEAQAWLAVGCRRGTGGVLLDRGAAASARCLSFTACWQLRGGLSLYRCLVVIIIGVRCVDLEKHGMAPFHSLLLGGRRVLGYWCMRGGWRHRGEFFFMPRGSIL